MGIRVLMSEKKTGIINTLVIISAAVFVWLWSDKSGGVIYSAYGGIEIESRELNLIKLGKWLFIYGLYFLLLIKQLTDNKKTQLFSIYRFGSFKAWWKSYFLKIHLLMLGSYVISCLVFYVIELITDNHSSNTIEVLFIFYVHLATYISIIIACNQMFTKSLVPCVLIVFEGITYLISVQSSVMISSCGMYTSMSRIDSKCMIITIMMAQLLIGYVCYYIVIWLWKKDYLDVIG